jgi:hypothetical protein
MLKAIQVNYEERGILGELEMRNDRREYGITEKHVDAAIEKVIRDGVRGYICAAHFNHVDGSNDSIWQEPGQRGTRMLTWRHDIDEWNREKLVEISAAKFKRMMKAEIE